MKWRFAIAALVALIATERAASAQNPPCPNPNPNLLGPGHFVDGCKLFASGLNLAAPLADPHFTGTIFLNGIPFTGGGGGAGNPALPIGSLQYNLNGTAFGGYVIGSSFSTSGGTFDLATGAAAFNIGVLGGDLAGTLPSPTLAVGSASRNVGNLGGGLLGTLPNPTLNPAAVVTALGTPSGDLGGSSYAAPLVTGLQGTPIASTPPTPQSALVFNGVQYAPTILSPGVNQGTGDVLFGPGSGAQQTTIANGVVTNAKLAQQAAQTIKGNPTPVNATPTDVPITGSLSFNGGALGLASIGTAQQITVSLSPSGTACLSISATGQTTVTSGSCSGGAELTADDGVTVLTADDATTHLTADGTSPSTPCNAIKGDFHIPCNAALVAIMR